MGNPSNLIIVEKIDNQEALKEAFDIRRTVFVEEQKVDEREEYDEFEDISVHFLAKSMGKPAGTARWRITPNGIKLERFAVLEEYRSEGVGSALLQSVLADLPKDGKKIYLHAQLTAVGLYKKFNFMEIGDTFWEAGIEHYKMELK